MKKHFFTLRITGFTLAEVLITLTVIGVIAALTIPSLITSIQDAQYHTAWKKAYSDLAQTTNRLLMDSGGTLNGLFQNNADMINKFSPYFSYTKTCPFSGANCWHNTNEWYYLNGGGRNYGNGPGFILNNGNLLMLMFSAQDCTNTAVAGNNMPICGFMYVDINGDKGPNTIGKDVYLTYITQNGLYPGGTRDGWPCSNEGYGCAAMYLKQ